MTATTLPKVNDHIVKATRLIEDRVGSVLLGKTSQVRIATAAIMSGEHLLLNDLPGVGKTTLGIALAKVIAGSFGRVQGTPDLLPTDLTGVTVFDQSNGDWVYRRGPLMNHVVLVDELSRVTPRTQSALLEAMAEGHVTVDGTTHELPNPFMVVATMNPVGSAGTFPLTAGQLDRFGAAISLGPPQRSAERKLLLGDGGQEALGGISSVLPAALLPELRGVVRNIHVSDDLVEYVLDICDRLRGDFHLSARAPLSLLNMGRAVSILEGRPYVVPDDIKVLAAPCLTHRLSREGERVDAQKDRVMNAVDHVAVPSVS